MTDKLNYKQQAEHWRDKALKECDNARKYRKELLALRQEREAAAIEKLRDNYADAVADVKALKSIIKAARAELQYVE